MSLSERVRERLAALKMSQRELAELTDVSQVSIHKLVAGKTDSFRRMSELASALQCDAHWLLTGMDSSLGLDSTPLGSHSSNDSFSNIPFYTNVELSAGHGCNNSSHSEVEYHQVPTSDLNALGMSKDKAVVCKVRGDSMLTTLHDGDLVLINTSIKRPVSGKIFAFSLGNDLRIKRFLRRLDNTWKISSDNKDDPTYEDETISNHDIESLHIIGQVVSLVRRQLI